MEMQKSLVTKIATDFYTQDNRRTELTVGASSFRLLLMQHSEVLYASHRSDGHLEQLRI